MIEPAAETLKSHSTIGEILRLAREEQGMSIEDIASQLKLSPKQVKALEDNRFETLPGITFTRGFIRNYARLLNVDVEPLLQNMVAADKSPNLGAAPRSMGELRDEHAKTRRWHKLTLGFLLIALMAFGIYYESVRRFQGVRPTEASKMANEQRPPSSVETTTPPVTIVPDAPSEPPRPSAEASVAQNNALESASKQQKTVESARQLELTFVDASWVEVRDRSGKILVAQNHPAGTQQVISADPPLSILIGNVPGVRITFGGQPVDLTPYRRHNVARLTLE